MKTKKKHVIVCLFACLFVCSGYADYTYEVYTYSPSHTLDGEQSILVDLEGGMSELTMFNNSSAVIKGTSMLERGSGGIWTLSLSGSSTLDMSGGQINMIATGNDATAFLSGGLIQQIWSSQGAWKQEGDPSVWVPNPHITIECLNHFYDTDTKFLTGHWLDDGSAFSIYLIDVDGYSPAIENIQFIPEPATLLLFGLGGLVVRRRFVR